jgi:hypothetical protein
MIFSLRTGYPLGIELKIAPELLVGAMMEEEKQDYNDCDTNVGHISLVTSLFIYAIPVVVCEHRPPLKLNGHLHGHGFVNSRSC